MFKYTVLFLLTYILLVFQVRLVIRKRLYNVRQRGKQQTPFINGHLYIYVLHLKQKPLLSFTRFIKEHLEIGSS